MSNSPQESEGEVDSHIKTPDATRARTREIEEVAQAIEKASHLHQGKTVQEIIMAHGPVRTMMVATAIRALAASKLYYSKIAKAFVPEADFQTQMKAVAWLAAYSDGLPTQTQLNINANADAMRSKPDLTPAAMLARSPAALEAMARTLREAQDIAASEAKTIQSQ
jgi:hypothetical protein